MELRSQAEVSCINRKWQEEVNLDGVAKEMELRTARELKMTWTYHDQPSWYNARNEMIAHPLSRKWGEHVSHDFAAHEMEIRTIW